MTAAQKAILVLAGLFMGAMTPWAPALAYSALNIERGFLAIPFAVVAVGGIALWRRTDLRPLAVGLIVGAAIETVFFLWLFAAFSRGLQGL